jgi:hypothetical protein
MRKGGSFRVGKGSVPGVADRWIGETPWPFAAGSRRQSSVPARMSPTRSSAWGPDDFAAACREAGMKDVEAETERHTEVRGITNRELDEGLAPGSRSGRPQSVGLSPDELPALEAMLRGQLIGKSIWGAPLPSWPRRCSGKRAAGKATPARAAGGCWAGWGLPARCSALSCAPPGTG